MSTSRAEGSFAIATPHWLASEAGAEAYRAGGNAIDAAVAAAATLTVVYPHNCAIGGDIVALVQTPGRGAIVVNGSGAAAAAASAKELRQAHAQMPLAGADPVTVPGAVAAWQTLLSLGGRRPLAGALEAAALHAEEGIPVSGSLAAAIRELRDELAADEGLREIFLVDGAPLPEGALLRQPALARTLLAIAAGGASALYAGAIGGALIARLRSLGSKLTLDDLAAHESELATPLAGGFDGLEVLTAPPNSQGFVLLEILAAIEALNGRAELDGDEAGVLARLFALTAGDRDRHLADPRFAEIPLADLLSATHARDLAREAASARPLDTATKVTAGTGDTVAVVAADAEGYAVSLIESIFSTFGARILDPATGILCHNRGSSFSLDPASPNVLAGGKRPAHTLMPVILRRDSRVVGVNGTMGGQAQAQIHTHLLLAARSGCSPPVAVRAARWTVGTLEEGGTVKVVAERDVAARAIASIEAAGFALETGAVLDEQVGHAQAVRLGEGGFLAGSDPRADGSAVVL